MGTLALLFPGQASQTVGMGVALRHADPAADTLFQLADQVSGLPITNLTENGPLDRLTETDVAQLAVVVTSMAALGYLRREAGEAFAPTAVAGHSAGELAAYVAAEVLDPADMLPLVHARAQAMAAACRAVDGTMAAVLQMAPDKLADVCASVSQPPASVVQVANDNAPGQVVISGERAAVQRACEAALAAGARRALPLNVGGPFHSVYMQPVADAMRGIVEQAPMRAAKIDVLANVTARPIRELPELRQELCTQVYSPVRWMETLRALAKMGCDRFVEVGPGEVLAGMVKRTLPEARVTSFGHPDQLPAVLGLLA